MVAFLGITFVLLIIVWCIYRFFKPNLYKLQDLYSSTPEYELYYQSAIEVPSYFNAQQSPSFAKDKVEQTIFYSTVFKALLTNNCLKTRLINPNNMRFVCLAANAAAKAIEDKKGSIKEQYNFACAIVCLLAKKSAFKHNVEGYCSNKIAEILDNQINILSIFEFRSEYYTEDLQVNNRNLALSCSNYDDILLKSEVDSAKLQSQSTAHNNGNQENSNLPTQQTPATTLNTQSTNQNKLDDSLSSDTKKDIVSGNKELATQRISPTTAKDSVSATPKQSPAKALSDTANEPVISDWSLESLYKEKDGSQSFANTQEASSTLYQEQEHARAQSLAKAQEQEQEQNAVPPQAQKQEHEHEQHSTQTQTQESIIVRQSEEERIKSAYENLSSNRYNFRLLDVSYFNKSALEALEYLEKNIRSLSRVGLSNMSENIKKPLEDFVCDGLKQNKLYEAAQKIEKQDELLLQTIYAFLWAISHINPNRYEQQIFTLEAIIGCLYFECFDDAYSSTAVIKSYLNEIKESDGFNDNQDLNKQNLNSSDIGSSSSNYPEQDYDYAQDTVNRLNIRDSSVNKVVYNAFKQFTAEQHNYIEDLQHYSLQKTKAMELLKTNLSSIVSLSEHMLDEESKAKFIQFVHDKLNEYHLSEDAKDLSFKGSLKQQVVNYFSFAMFLAQGNLQEQKIFALEAMLICCFYDGFETIEDYINLYLSESFDSENELESDAIANQNHEPASQGSHELSSDQSNQETKDRLEPDMSHETATKPEHEQDKAMEQSSSQSSISKPDSTLKPNSQAINANSSLESAQTMASDNSDQSNQETKDRFEPDMPLENATKPEHEQNKAMEQNSISNPDSALKPNSQAINANSSLESEQTIASDNSAQSNRDIKDRLEPDMSLETANKPEHEQDKAMEQSSINKPDSGLKPNSQALNANSSLESAQTIASQTSHQPKIYHAENSSSSIRQSSNSGYGSGSSSSSSSGYRSVSNLGASSAHGNSNSLARNMHSGANSISSGCGSGSGNNNRNTVVVLRRNISANKKGSLTNLGLSEQYAKYANSGLSITRSPQKPYKYLNQRQYNDIQHKTNDLDNPPKTAPRVFTANKPSSSLYEDISNDIRSSKGYNTTTFRPKQNLEAYAPSEEEIFKLSNSNPNSKKHDLSNIRRLCIEENRTPSWFRRKTSWIKDKDNSVFANWLHDVLRDQFDIELNKLSIEQQQLIAQVALGLASSMENAGGEREVQMIYIKNFFRQKFTKEQIESFNKLQDYLEHI